MIYEIKNKFRKLSHSNKIWKSAYSVANQIKIRLLSEMSDEKFAKLKYKENTGETLNIKDPKTYNEKLWWLKINNRDPLLTICSDKYKVRDYVKDCGLDNILIRTYGIYDSADEIDFREFPEKVIIKCTHGSGTNIIYDKNNKNFETEKFKKKFNVALKQNYYYQSREWNYKNIQSKLIAEEVLEDKGNKSLIDYRFLCFDGKVQLVLVDIDTMAPDGTHAPNAKRNIYDSNFNLIDMKIGRENFDGNLVRKPQNFETMVEYAEILSKPFPHCRVDLYNIEGQIYFGEITFYPGGSTQKITPKEWDIRLGSWIDINSEKILKN
ncbi:ATP-grasp fold amidoligase family protein [Oceanobacillus rekensis]|uniref:ATP-grasp fold amidoligase family protein n=1 Tax=Oceanobacillus rekensis TaxID=937927 RepID=UPI001C3DE309|nr:ATP-grasp fold amidoligase family protein [Oceanobacillus rekensis]